MYKYILAGVMLASCADYKLTKAYHADCGKACYPKNYYYSHTGQCTSGYWYCEDIDSDPVCRDYGEPTGEVCDGVDNDCDGLVDEVVQTCFTACGKGQRRCVNGDFGECETRAPSEEICDGVDNDCDGTIDNVKYDSPYCYDADPETLGCGECRAGIKRCEFGVEICKFQVLPTPEKCDGLDNNCNCVIDESASTELKQFAFMFDNSCSMGTYNQAVRTTMSTWSSKYKDRADMMGAVVMCPHPDRGTYGDNPVMTTNFTQIANIASDLGLLSDSGSGLEYTYDAMVLMSMVPNNPLGLSWSATSKKAIVVFADEKGQSYQDLLDEYAVAVTLANSPHKIKVFIMTSATPGCSTCPSPVYTYDDITLMTKGKLYLLSTDPAVMDVFLDEILRIVSCEN